MDTLRLLAPIDSFNRPKMTQISFGTPAACHVSLERCVS